MSLSVTSTTTIRASWQRWQNAGRQSVKNRKKFGVAKHDTLEATLKKASALLGDGTTPDTTPDTGKDTPGGDNTDQGGSGTTGEGGGDGLE